MSFLVEGDSKAFDWEIATFASCAAVVFGKAIYSTTRVGGEKALAATATMLETAVDDVKLCDNAGDPASADFAEFLVLHASGVPSLDISHLETPSTLNPLGVKGVGEAGCIGTAAAMACGVADGCVHAGASGLIRRGLGRA
jgi:CO/xanthine dehydrogenase Mo-binding subunit